MECKVSDKLEQQLIYNKLDKNSHKMITDYKNLTINKYLEIKDILNDDGGELNIQSRIISCLADMDLDDVLNLSLTRYNELAQKTAFLMEKPKLTGRIPNKLNINGRECTITKNVNKLTAAQYIDYQTLTAQEDSDKYIAAVIACFIVPVGFTYGDGYDVQEIAEWLGDNLSILDALNVCFFFRKKYLDLIKRTLVYLELRMRMIRTKKETPEIQMKMKELKKMIHQYRMIIQESGDGLLW